MERIKEYGESLLNEQNGQKQEKGCGNGICKPNLGETSTNCFKDRMSEVK